MLKFTCLQNKYIKLNKKHLFLSYRQIRSCSTNANLDKCEQGANKPPRKTKQIKQLLQLYKPEKRAVAISSIALGISTTVTMCVPAGMGYIIDIVSNPSMTHMLPQVTAMLGGLFVCGACSNVIRVNSTNMIGERISARLRQNVYGSILRQDMMFFDKTRTGELVNRLSSDTTIIGDVLADNVSQGLRSTAQAVAGISMLFYTCPKLAFMMCAVVPPIAIGAVSYGRYVKKLTSTVQDRLSTSTSIAEEKISNIRTVRWFGAEDIERRQYNANIQDVLDLAQKRSYASAGFFGGVDLGVKTSMLAVLGYGGQMVAMDVLSVGELTSFLMYTIYVGFSFTGMSSFYTNLMKGMGASSRIFDLLHRKPDIIETQHQTASPKLVGNIEFQNVKFSYPSRLGNAVLCNFNLDMRSNETIALVGPSGCGKSTVAALLARFYELNQDGCGGKILIDGMDISSMEASALRQQLACVSQEPPLFAGTIASNIAYGNLGCSMAEIMDSAKKANAHEFISKLPLGYDTQVGERGQSLSGGQKQRIAIARALVRIPSILILDEATSALDIESEHLIQQAIHRVKENRTVLLISHRLSTIRQADRIAVISDGAVVEKGTYEELMQNSSSIFADVVNKFGK